MLAIGGFSGSDRAVSVLRLAELVERGELRFVYAPVEEGRRSQPEISDWLAAHCAEVAPAEWGGGAPGFGAPRGSHSVFDCRGR